MAAAQCVARHGGDHRLADAADGFPVARDVFILIDGGEVIVGHGTDVGASRKCLIATGDDHGADALVGIEGKQRGAKLVHQRIVERVQRLRAVERNEADTTSRFDQNVLVGHENSSWNRCNISRPTGRLINPRPRRRHDDQPDHSARLA